MLYQFFFVIPVPVRTLRTQTYKMYFLRQFCVYRCGFSNPNCMRLWACSQTITKIL